MRIFFSEVRFRKKFLNFSRKVLEIFSDEHVLQLFLRKNFVVPTLFFLKVFEQVQTYFFLGRKKIMTSICDRHRCNK